MHISNTSAIQIYFLNKFSLAHLSIFFTVRFGKEWPDFYGGQHGQGLETEAAPKNSKIVQVVLLKKRWTRELSGYRHTSFVEYFLA
jgi:hypothetical protein